MLTLLASRNDLCSLNRYQWRDRRIFDRHPHWHLRNRRRLLPPRHRRRDYYDRRGRSNPYAVRNRRLGYPSILSLVPPLRSHGDISRLCHDDGFARKDHHELSQRATDFNWRSNDCGGGAGSGGGGPEEECPDWSPRLGFRGGNSARGILLMGEEASHEDGCRCVVQGFSAGTKLTSSSPLSPLPWIIDTLSSSLLPAKRPPPSHLPRPPRLLPPLEEQECRSVHPEPRVVDLRHVDNQHRLGRVPVRNPILPSRRFALRRQLNPSLENRPSASRLSRQFHSRDFRPLAAAVVDLIKWRSHRSSSRSRLAERVGATALGGGSPVRQPKARRLDHRTPLGSPRGISDGKVAATSVPHHLPLSSSSDSPSSLSSPPSLHPRPHPNRGRRPSHLLRHSFAKVVRDGGVAIRDREPRE